MSLDSALADNPPIRHPELLRPGSSALLVIDLQTKLVPLIPQAEHVVWNTQRLIRGALALQVPVFVTEQYPHGLGPTIPEILGVCERSLALPPLSKLSFSAGGCAGLQDALTHKNITQVLLCGIETHVCVAQTALDLLAAALTVQVAVDAVGARHAMDHDVALQRLLASGVTLTTTEAALFEWCQAAGTPHFKDISNLIREAAPNH